MVSKVGLNSFKRYIKDAYVGNMFRSEDRTKLILNANNSLVLLKAKSQQPISAL
jgi:hypothetical protein